MVKGIYIFERALRINTKFNTLVSIVLFYHFVQKYLDTLAQNKMSGITVYKDECGKCPPFVKSLKNKRGNSIAVKLKRTNKLSL